MIPLHAILSVGFVGGVFLVFFCFVFVVFFFYMFRRLIIGVDWQCPGPITWQSDSVKTL